MKKGFTLAEIMVALVVIGVITSILLPVAFNNVPNENIMKFKKGNATLAKVVNELVTSGEYYTPGDLGKDKNGDWVDSTTYFLKTFSDLLTVKETVLPQENKGDYIINHEYANGLDINMLDKLCATKQKQMTSYIKTIDNIYYYQEEDRNTFGADWKWFGDFRNPFYVPWDDKVTYKSCVDKPTKQEQDDCVLEHSKSGFYLTYNIFCMDIDGINQGEEPFGYGIRVDGKIILGNRAQEWLEKSIQDKG